MRITLKDFIADGLIIGMGACWLLVFWRFWRYGQFLMAESNILYLSLETAGFIFIIAFGISRARRHIKELIKDGTA